MLLKLFLVCSFLCSFTAAFTTWQVSSNCAGVSNCFTNLTGAIFHAEPNDYISIAAGEWPIYQDVNLYGKPLSIVGAGSGSTVINCTTGYEWDFYYSPYYVQGVTFVGCYELYVQQASLSLQDVVLDSCEYSLDVYYGTIKMRSVTIQGQTEYSYAYASDLQWLDDANFLNQVSGSYGLEIEESTMSVAGDATFSCSLTSSLSSSYSAIYFDEVAMNIGGNFNIQNCGGSAIYGYYGAVTIGGDWVNTNITCSYYSYMEEGSVIVYGNYVVTDSTATGTECYFLEIYELGMEVFGDFTFQNVQFSGTSAYLVYLDDYTSLIIHGNTLFTNIHYEGTGGTPGIISYYSFLKTMGTFTMNNIFFNSTNGVSIEGVMYMYESTWESEGAVLLDSISGQGYYLFYIEESIFVSYSTFTISNCKNFLLDEYIMYFYDGAWTAYDTLTIANNVGGEYGALYYEDSGLTCYEAFILSNNTGYYEGGAYVEDSGLVFNGPVTISGNKATYSDGYTGGLYLEYSGMSTFSSATINNNYGGGMVLYESAWLAQGDVTMSGNVNPWDENQGGAMYLDYASSWVTYGNTVLSNNKANSTGGAVALYYESVWRSVGAVTITNNQANQAGGGVWIADSENSVWASQGPMTISGNSAPLGGGVYVGSGTSWANSFYDASFSSNSASDGGSDIFCNAGYLFSLSKSCNSSTVACVPGCQFGLIDVFLSLSATSLTFNNTFSSQSVTVSLSSALPVALNVGYSLTLSTPSLANQVVINPAGSIPFPAGTTSVTITVALNSSLAQTNQWVTVQGNVQLLPPTPELLVFLGSDSSLALGINIAPSSSDSVRMMSSWLMLFSHLVHLLSSFVSC